MVGTFFFRKLVIFFQKTSDFLWGSLIREFRAYGEKGIRKVVLNGRVGIVTGVLAEFLGMMGLEGMINVD